MESKVLSIKNLKKLYGNNRGVRNITLDVFEGDVVGLLGPNGSGKTTAMKTVLGMNHADNGEIKLFGCDIDTDYEAAMRNVGALIETPAIYDRMSAYKNLILATRYYSKYNKKQAEERVKEVLELVNLEDYAKDKAGKFSLGMRQRLGIALALVSEPRLVILDEPTNGLDIEGVVHIRDVVKNMSENEKTAFLISGHVASEMEKMCNKIAIIFNGEVKAFEKTETILSTYPSLEDYFLSVVGDAKKGNITKLFGGEDHVRNIG